MKKTIQVAADRAFDQAKTVLPAEVARGVYIENPPSAEALKLMHLLIGKAGGKMAQDMRHELRLADIKKIDGMRNHSRATLRKLFVELAGAVIVFDNTAEQCEIIGGFLDQAQLDYRDEVSGDILVSWWFGRAFRSMADKSCHWAILDRQTVFALSSKYSILLFQHIASLVNLTHTNSKTFSVEELRTIMGVADDKLARFTHLNGRAIKPAIAEISALSRFNLTAKTNKVGRSVSSVTIEWAVKPDPTETKRELDRPKVGRKARLSGAVEAVSVTQAFPSSGSIVYSRWGDMAREELPEPRRDLDLVAGEFRNWCAGRGIDLDAKNIEKTFRGFCRKVKPAQ